MSVTAASSAAVVLAAGLSERMGAKNKLLLEVGGEPLVRRCVLAVVAAGVGDVVVVLGHDSQRMALELGPLPVRLVVNPDFNAGQMSSVHCGLSAVGEGCDAVMICLADQPRLTAAHINSLLHAFDTLPPHQSIVVPVCNEQRGNPIVISEQVRQEVVRRGPNPGCRAYIDDHPERVCWLPVNDAVFVTDVDTPADFDALSRDWPS
jgi:molybdenum cofactor cytidylyltransferase